MALFAYKKINSCHSGDSIIVTPHCRDAIHRASTSFLPKQLPSSLSSRTSVRDLQEIPRHCIPHNDSHLANKHLRQYNNAAIKKQHAFTLIEILVALVILAIALTAVVKSINDNLSFAADLQDRTIANWVGDNVLARMQAGLITPPANGNTNGNQQMLGNSWYWQASGQRQENSDITRVTINVSKTKNAQPDANIIGFIRVGT